MKHALVTGGAGFIGSHCVEQLLAKGWRVTAVDNFDPFYDPLIKRANLKLSEAYDSFKLVELDVRNVEDVRSRLVDDYDVIVHLAAKPGVRPSIRNSAVYHDVNVRGTENVLELARERRISQFVFASSSSVYGINPRVPWSEDDHLLQPISPYASSKVSGEALGHVYSYLYGIRFIGLRFFSVYGPRQRPDLAIYKFARALLQGDPVLFYGDGATRRDYTAVDDIVSGTIAAIDYVDSMYELFNLGNSETVSLSELVSHLEKVLGVRAIRDPQPDQLGDMPQTWADISKARALLGYKPCTEFREGLQRFALWLRSADQLKAATHRMSVF